MSDPKRPCLVCGKECAETDRNTDGTYAHRHCLHQTSLRPPGGKGPKGGNLYGSGP